MSEELTTSKDEQIRIDHCFNILQVYKNRVLHYINRARELGLDPEQTMITILCVDDPYGGPIAKRFMPNNDDQWNAMRAQGLVPYAVGVTERQGVAEVLAAISQRAADDFDRHLSLPIVVVDACTAAVFDSAGLLIQEILDTDDEDEAN